MIKDTYTLKGSIKATLIDGDQITIYEFPNAIVGGGITFAVDRMISFNPNVMSHMAIGTGNSTVEVTDTTLDNEIARVAFDSVAKVTTNITDDSIEYTATFPPGTGTGVIVEAGLFNASSGGLMVNRAIFGAITKTITGTLVLVWKVVVQ